MYMLSTIRKNTNDKNNTISDHFDIISLFLNQDELEKLKAKNQELRNKLQQIESEIDDFQFSAAVAEKDNDVKLGDEYLSEIGILVYKEKSPVRVQLGKFVDNGFKPTSDTLFEKLKHGGVYKFIPNETGIHQYGGQVEFDFFDTTIVRYFQMEFNAVN